ncbi:hypothetical protein ARMSODRAFT_783350 [Armillaria solidipes]|uniref:Uncharacterized protein n=1 Tax=Armillaria solidipes TaxID=1076256 RepID=A0A2H3BXE2_9AGAR|nr:hypothetical protein ARMSODRAFT_783350 [Armillaria solidipes]
MEDGPVADNDDVLTASQQVPPADAPIDRIAELESIVHELRAFVAGENRHVILNGCLTSYCKNEEIEDAVYALGMVFDLEYRDTREGLCVKFALRLDTPAIIDDDKLRGIICGDLLNTPTRAMAKGYGCGPWTHRVQPRFGCPTSKKYSD